MKSIGSKLLAALAVFVIIIAAYTLGSAGVFKTDTASAAPILYSQDDVTAIYEAASPAVVEIDVTEQGIGYFGRSLMEGLGSGFLIDTEGHILTNNHVISGATTVTVKLGEGKSVDATVVGTDTIDDLALLKVEASAVSGITPLQLADSSAVKPGQMAIAIGSPYGYDDTITIGVISGVNRTIGSGSMTGMLQTDASINPGNSGGPLLDIQGNVIGINTAIESTINGAGGLGFAVPSDVAERALPDLLAGRQETRPWLGISGATVTETLAQELSISVNQGIYVSQVAEGSPAEKAGLIKSSDQDHKGGDVITAIDGKNVTTISELSSYISSKKAGDTISLTVVRGGNTITVQATLEARPEATSSNTQPRELPQPEIPMPWGWRSR